MDVVSPTLSVVVISWNQIEFIQRLVGQLLDQEFDPHDYEVLVVDDGSADGTQEWLCAQTDPRVKALISGRLCGRSASRNTGIRAARGSVIVMIDGDHTVRRDFLAAHARRHRGKFCAIVGKSDFVEHPDYRALNRYLNQGGAYKLPADQPLPGRYFLTRNCSVPKQALIDIGLFDEEFAAWGGEDLDLGARIEDAGIPIYGDSASLAMHHHLRPLPELLDNLYRYGREGIPMVLRKHPRMFRELNLDRILNNPLEPNRYGALYRLCMRLAMSAPIYRLVKWKAQLFRRFILPRVVFDYLHLRQYARGYIDYLRENRETHGNPD